MESKQELTRKISDNENTSSNIMKELSKQYEQIITAMNTQLQKEKEATVTTIEKLCKHNIESVTAERNRWVRILAVERERAEHEIQAVEEKFFEVATKVPDYKVMPAMSMARSLRAKLRIKYEHIETQDSVVLDQGLITLQESILSEHKRQGSTRVAEHDDASVDGDFGF